MLNFTSLIQELFLKAGWEASPESCLADVGAESTEHVAEKICAEFGGLRVGTTGPGRDLAASDVCFYAAPKSEEFSIAEPWRKTAGNLVAIASAHHDHMVLLVSASGTYYVFTDPDAQLYLIGRSLAEAMERLLRGLDYGSPIVRDIYSVP